MFITNRCDAVKMNLAFYDWTLWLCLTSTYIYLSTHIIIYIIYKWSFPPLHYIIHLLFLYLGTSSNSDLYCVWNIRRSNTSAHTSSLGARSIYCQVWSSNYRCPTLLLYHILNYKDLVARYELAKDIFYFKFTESKISCREVKQNMNYKTVQLKICQLLPGNLELLVGKYLKTS